MKARTFILIALGAVLALGFYVFGARKSSHEKDRQLAIAEVADAVGTKAERVTDATIIGFPDRTYCARISLTSTEFDSIVQRLDLKATDIVQPVGSPRLAQCSWRQTDHRPIELFTNYRGGSDGLPARLVTLGADPSRELVFAEVFVEY